MAAWERAGLPVARVPLLTMRDMRERLGDRARLIMLDVRQAHEWGAGHIAEAVHAEAGSLAGGLLALPFDATITVHCGHGQRAAMALSVLEHQGFADLALVTEGVDEWRAAGGPTAPGTQPAAPRK
jgi:rhodanese-related sulfurtransferase